MGQEICLLQAEQIRDVIDAIEARNVDYIEQETKDELILFVQQIFETGRSVEKLAAAGHNVGHIDITPCEPGMGETRVAETDDYHSGDVRVGPGMVNYADPSVEIEKLREYNHGLNDKLDALQAENNKLQSDLWELRLNHGEQKNLIAMLAADGERNRKNADRWQKENKQYRDFTKMLLNSSLY